MIKTNANRLRDVLGDRPTYEDLQPFILTEREDDILNITNKYHVTFSYPLKRAFHTNTLIASLLDYEMEGLLNNKLKIRKNKDIIEFIWMDPRHDI